MINNASLDQLEVDEENKYSTHTKKKLVFKNLIIIGLSWMLLFTAYNSIANLQSSLNTDAGLGTVGLSVTYVAFILSCLLLPTILIKHFGIKWTIFLSQLTYILYVGLNIYPRYYTLIPSAFLLGSGPLWTAQSTFLTDLATFYSNFSGENREIIINRFFGIFFALFQSSQIWGNLIISTVLKSETQIDNALQNVSFCGKNDHPSITNEVIKKPTQISVYILCAIFVFTAIVGSLLIIFFIDSYKSIGLNISEEQNKSPIKLLLNTLKNMKQKDQILLIPLTTWLGFQQAYLLADFTKSFVSCIKGINYVGYVMVVYGVSSTIGSYWFGYMVKLVGRKIGFGLLTFLNLVSILLQLVWEPQIQESFVLYIIAIIWGATDAGWNTQINAFYGFVFKGKEEAAFSNLKLWQSVGYAVSFAYSNLIQTDIKLYLLLVYLTIGMIGYILVELRKIRHSREEV